MKIRYTLLFTTMLFLCALSASAQEVIRVTGKVTAKLDTMLVPQYMVNVYDVKEKRLVARTDEDGRYVANVRNNAQLRFSVVGATPVVIKVNGRAEINVQLEQTGTELGEAGVVVKRNKKKPEIIEASFETHGNWLTVTNPVTVPDRIFKDNRRMVLQRVLKNYTKKTDVFMTPLVYDNVEYHQTQDRLYAYEMDGAQGDPLARYVLVKEDSLHNDKTNKDVILYKDSIWVANPNDSYKAITYLAIENYNRIVYCDTIMTSRGTIRPMRWLDYSFTGSEITDPALYPKPDEPKLHDCSGSIDLRFPIGKAEFDPADEHNVLELQKLRSQVDSIAATRDATLQALSIHGTSSPDGKYSHNLTLAQQRMRYAVNYLKGQLPSGVTKGMKFSSSAAVAPWSEVAKLMRKDSLDQQAEQVEYIAKRYKGDAQSTAAKRLPFYSTLLQGKYLPQLRTVGYDMTYSIYRQLTIDEIRELYKKDYKQLSRYEFFQLYKNEPNTDEQEKILRQALEVSPSFMVAANDLAAMQIKKGEPDANILRRFAGKKAPAVVNQNQMVALLANNCYSEADSLAEFVNNTEENKLLLSVCEALNGKNLQENYEIISQTGVRNEVVMLLTMKKNKEALSKSRELNNDEAVSHYLKAICLYRVNAAEYSSSAKEELFKAFKMDKSLIDIAEGDGDVNELISDNVSKAQVENIRKGIIK